MNYNLPKKKHISTVNMVASFMNGSQVPSGNAKDKATRETAWQKLQADTTPIRTL